MHGLSEPSKHETSSSLVSFLNCCSLKPLCYSTLPVLWLKTDNCNPALNHRCHTPDLA